MDTLAAVNAALESARRSILDGWIEVDELRLVSAAALGFAIWVEREANKLAEHEI